MVLVYTICGEGATESAGQEPRAMSFDGRRLSRLSPCPELSAQPELSGGGISAASAVSLEGLYLEHLLVFIFTLFLSVSSFHLIALQDFFGFFLSLTKFICNLRSC